MNTEKISACLTREAEIRAESADVEHSRFDIIWSTGQRVRRFSWSSGPYDEELLMEKKNVQLARLNDGAPFLNTHNSYDLSDVLGAVVPGSARVEDGQGVATVQMSRRPEIANIIMDIKDRILRNISVGYRVHKVEKEEADDGSIPVWRAVLWEPLELSAVPIGADSAAHFRNMRAHEICDCEIVRVFNPRLIRRRMRMRLASI
jgi:phage head maturation protease